MRLILQLFSFTREKFSYKNANIFSLRISARPMHLQELDSYYMHFSVCVYIYIFVFRLCVSFRGNTEADLVTMKEPLQHFSVVHFDTCFSVSMRRAFFFEQMPPSAKTFEIFPLVLRFCLTVGSMP